MRSCAQCRTTHPPFTSAKLFTVQCRDPGSRRGDRQRASWRVLSPSAWPPCSGALTAVSLVNLLLQLLRDCEVQEAGSIRRWHERSAGREDIPASTLTRAGEQSLMIKKVVANVLGGGNTRACEQALKIIILVTIMIGVRKCGQILWWSKPVKTKQN